MIRCGDYRDSLLLDVHEEMEPEVRREWDTHLEGCEGCREERERLLQLMARIREEMPQLEPSPGEAAAIHRSIRRAVDAESKKLYRARHGFLGIGLRPAFAAAMVLAMALGWIGFREFDGRVPIHLLKNGDGEERLISQNLDLLEDMDFLEDMDVIQELVQAVDHGDAT
jgi:anti-sigma factor RsiW